MKRASQLFEYTARTFDAADVQQKGAQGQWHVAVAAEAALQPEAATLELKAHATQAAAAVQIEGARVYFNSGWAALEAMWLSC